MYSKGTDPTIDECIDLEPRITEFLRQDREERVTFAEASNGLEGIFG